MTETTPYDPLALESQVCFALAVASRSVVNAYKSLLTPLRLTHPQYLVMLAMWQHAPLSIKRLGELLHLDPGTVTPLAKRLESLGYIERTRNPDDERYLAITLTAEGRALREKAQGVPAQMMQRLDMDEAELLALHRSMLKVIKAAHEADAPDRGPRPAASAH